MAKVSPQTSASAADNQRKNPFTLSFPQVFFLGILLVLSLRVLSGLLLLGLAHAGPTFPGKAFQEILQILPLPILVILTPILLACVIIAVSDRPQQENRDHTVVPPVPEGLPEDEENRRLFAPRYTPAHLVSILKWIIGIWFILLGIQLLLWFAFSAYAR